MTLDRRLKLLSLLQVLDPKVCQLQLTLLQLRESDSGEPSQRQGALGELINKAQAKMKEARVKGSNTGSRSSGFRI